MTPDNAAVARTADASGEGHFPAFPGSEAAPVEAPRAPTTSWVTRIINDPRDTPFLVLIAASTAIVLPFAVALFIPGVFRWWLAALYIVVNFAGFLDRFILMLHNTSHRTLFKPRWRFMNSYIPWVLGPLFGETPETYFAHHVGMHHLEANLPEDLSTTMPYQRDSLRHFLHYYFSFMTRGLYDLAAYLKRKKRIQLRTRMLWGEGSFYALTLVLAFFVNWRAALVVFVFPLVAVRFLMMAGNWGQHAFVDAKTPGDSYRNSITVLEARYNRRCFNDGYHIGHHLKATRHWTEMPTDFESNRAAYLREKAIVFKDIDFFGVWARLMTGNYKSLAKHYLHLGETRPSDEQIIALLRERVQAIPPA
jgi:hypothetical protein